MRIPATCAIGAAVLTWSCASAPPPVARPATAPLTRFPVDPPPSRLHDHCSDLLGDGACQRVETLRTAVAGLQATHAAQEEKWSAAVENLRAALAAGFERPAIDLDLPETLPEQWSSPDAVAPMATIIRLEADAGLARSRKRAALESALSELAAVSRLLNEEWSGQLQGPAKGVEIPTAIVEARSPITVHLKWADRDETLVMPKTLVEPLRKLPARQKAVVSLVVTDAGLPYMDLASEEVALPEPFAMTWSDARLDLLEQPATRIKVTAGSLKAPVAAACRKLRAEVRFVDVDEWPARRFAVSPKGARSSR